ncbi:MAG TPA: hypothetical protein VM889_12415 [Candidatus Thermoplasmatota archaeon]|nr:hypothetical protein [Candidatus Thermoplasmatota archaeon]
MLAKAIVTALLPALALLVAGCVTPNAAQVGGPDGGSDTGPAGACDVLYPDNTTFDCATSRVTPASLDGRPALGSGWTCISRWTESDDDLGAIEVYVHSDGRAGLYWESVPFKNPGEAFVVANIFESETKGQALVVNWSAKGFAVFPQKPPATAELHTTVRNLQLDVLGPDGTWRPEPNATVVAGDYLGHDWLVWSFDVEGETHYADSMVSKTKEGSLRKYTPAKKHIEGDGWAAFSTVETWGVKHMKFTFAANSGTAVCPTGLLPDVIS